MSCGHWNLYSLRLSVPSTVAAAFFSAVRVTKIRCLNVWRLGWEGPECSGVRRCYDSCRFFASNAPPVFANPSEEVSMISSSYVQGLLITENAG